MAELVATVAELVAMVAVGRAMESEDTEDDHADDGYADDGYADDGYADDGYADRRHTHQGQCHFHCSSWRRAPGLGKRRPPYSPRRVVPPAEKESRTHTMNKNATHRER